MVGNNVPNDFIEMDSSLRTERDVKETNVA